MTAAAEDPHIGLIVEGPGDFGATPRLLRGYLHSIGMYQDMLGEPLAANGLGNLTVAGGIEKFVNIAQYRPGCAGILVIVDADRECPVSVGQGLLARVSDSRVPVVICVADRNFEDWLYASLESFDLPGSPVFVAGEHGGAALHQLLPSGYRKTVDQPRLAARIDYGLVSGRNDSLDRLFTKVAELAAIVPSGY